jgi:serine/threonine-protein kinase
MDCTHVDFDRAIDDKCDRFESQWRSGDRPRIEDFLAAKSDGDEESLLRQLLCLEWELLSAEGRRPDLSEYCRRYADAAGLVRQVYSEALRDPTSPLFSLLAEDRSADYEIIDEVMGVIYRVRDRRLNRTIAMKVLRSAPDEKRVKQGVTKEQMLARFLEEAQITAQLEHPGIVPVYDRSIDEHGRPFFTMKLVKGRDLSQIFQWVRQREEGWNVLRAVGIMVRVCQAVAYAHSKGVVHRDLKPSNIMVDNLGEVYVMDWGLARVLGQRGLHELRPQLDMLSTQTEIRTDRSDSSADVDSPLSTMDGTVVGTPTYMSLEQTGGRLEEVNEKSDIYSLGAILYNLLTGQPPYVSPGPNTSPHTILASVLRGPPAPLQRLNPQASRELSAVCEKAMSRDAGDRYTSCLDMAEDLQAYLDNRVVRAYRTGPYFEFKSWVLRNRLTSTVIACALTLAFALLFIFAIP